MYTEQSFTIVTDPMPIGRHLLLEVFKKIMRAIKYFFFSRPLGSHPYYRGHVAVTRSLLEGLAKRNSSVFNYNPNLFTRFHPTLLVLSGVTTLKQAISLKRKGKIKKIIAGPNIVIFSSDFNNLIASSEIDLVITPSEIINQLYILDNPSLKGRIAAWPAGVDTEFWKPNPEISRKQILIYEKQIKGPVGPVEPYADYLRSLGYQVHVIQYGNYTLEEYKKQLLQSFLMIGCVTDESQGIAWAEAWSCDVPTFLWNNHSNIYRGRIYSCTTAPYLTEENGIFFDNFSDFTFKLQQWENNAFSFEPRKWCLENMSDEVCANNLLKILETC